MKPPAFDWNQARAFLATAEEGSLSAAARALGQTQPTLSRQVSALEADLGITLFERVGRSLALTQSGRALLEHFRAMAEAADRAALAATGRSQAIEGRVSITATELMAAHYLPPVLQELRALAPGIELEIVVSSEVRDLTRREADIALRHVRPTQPDLIAKLVDETSAHLYASRGYLDRFGRPRSPADLSTADFVGFQHPERLLPVLNGLGLQLTKRNFMLYSESGTVILALVRQGLGVFLWPKDAAELYPDLEPILPELPSIPVPTWLVTHRELHTSARIRLVFDHLAEAFARRRSQLPN